MLSAALALVVLAQAPLNVRVLAREGLRHASLSRVSSGRCDGVDLSPADLGKLEVRAREQRVGWSNGSCSVMEVEPVPGQLLRLDSDSTPQRGYAGMLRFQSEGSQLVITEQIDLERYVAAVVAAEADGASSEALKAQAVVSRSYALAGRGRHKAAGYDLCDLTHGRAGNG